MVLSFQGARSLEREHYYDADNFPFLDKILGVTIQATKIMTPLLGFPRVSSLSSVTELLCILYSTEKSQPQRISCSIVRSKIVAVTQQGVDNSLISVNALKLLNGDYILLPKSQEEDFQKSMDKLIVQNGYLVERDASGVPDAQD